MASDDAQDVNSSLTNDPLAAQREDGTNFRAGAGQFGQAGVQPDRTADLEERKNSADEFDASKTKPSAFGKRKDSIHATPASRDSHTDKNRDRDSAFHTLADSMNKGLFGLKNKKKSISKESGNGKDGDAVAEQK